jgi:hypothetical protein
LGKEGYRKQVANVSRMNRKRSVTLMPNYRETMFAVWGSQGSVKRYLHKKAKTCGSKKKCAAPAVDDMSACTAYIL